MIQQATIIQQPESGKFKEIIFDKNDPFNSNKWTWIKFTDLDDFEWIGEFRGAPRNVAVSEKLEKTLIVTTDYLFFLDNHKKEVVELERQPQYNNLTVAPNGEFVISDNYNIEIIEKTLKKKKMIKPLFDMDCIEFKKWDGANLIFTCEQIPGWEKVYEMSLDSHKWKISQKNAI